MLYSESSLHRSEGFDGELFGGGLFVAGAGGGVEVVFGFLGLAEGLVGAASVVEDVGVFAVEGEGLVEALEGFLGFAEYDEGGAAAVVGAGL